MQQDISQTPPEPGRETDMALIVRLCGEAMAIPVRHVHEVMDPLPRTRVPRATALAPWLVNVRGTVVPLVDIRDRLRMSREPPADGRIVVLNVEDGGQIHRLALLSDTVEQVAEIDFDRIEPLPEGGSTWPETYVRGACRCNDELVLVLNSEALFRPSGGTALNS